jgi:HipA-like C-terminal domain
MPCASAPGLAAALRISVRSLHRLLAELSPGQLVCAGRSRRTRYALRRPLRGDRNDIPLHAVDEAGQATLLSKLALVHPQGALMSMADSGWPVPPESRDGWWDGLPYPLYDIRHQGYIGRQFARAEHQMLGVSPNPEEWSDDDIVFALSRAGADVSGNLVLGDEAYRRWLQTKLAPPEPVSEADIGRHYADCAQDALRGSVAGSSAAGEFPKFTAVREHGHATPHVLVKFSGPSESAAERRWADLLVCEHLVLECADTLPGVTGARTRLVQYGARVFLESERFDRVGLHGRLPVCTLEALSHAFLGVGSSDWALLLSRLHDLGLVDADTVRAVERLWWFGCLVANTDMHLGNLSFRIAPTLRLAPAYDMLPMTYAPLPGGELPPREFVPPLPLPAQREAWQIACTIALGFWHRASTDVRISPAFQSVCDANYRQLNELAARL